MILDAGVMWNGVPGVKAGAIIIGILLGTMTVFVIEKQLHKAGFNSAGRVCPGLLRASSTARSSGFTRCLPMPSAI